MGHYLGVNSPVEEVQHFTFVWRMAEPKEAATPPVRRHGDLLFNILGPFDAEVEARLAGQRTNWAYAVHTVRRYSAAATKPNFDLPGLTAGRQEVDDAVKELRPVLGEESPVVRRLERAASLFTELADTYRPPPPARTWTDEDQKNFNEARRLLGEIQAAINSRGGA